MRTGLATKVFGARWSARCGQAPHAGSPERRLHTSARRVLQSGGHVKTRRAKPHTSISRFKRFNLFRLVSASAPSTSKCTRANPCRRSTCRRSKPSDPVVMTPQTRDVRGLVPGRVRSTRSRAPCQVPHGRPNLHSGFGCQVPRSGEHLHPIVAFAEIHNGVIPEVPIHWSVRQPVLLATWIQFRARQACRTEFGRFSALRGWPSPAPTQDSAPKPTLWAY